MDLHPFWLYYGAKWRLAPKYPAPRHDVVCEPFAGAAGYSLRHYQKKVILCDINPVIVGVWDYIIHASREEVARLPDFVFDIDTDPELVSAPQEAKWLIGFWMNAACVTPMKSLSQWHVNSMIDGKKSGWERGKEVLLRQQESVRHWEIHQLPYWELGNEDDGATWFIDPPYNNKAGSYYTYGAAQVDFARLADFCRTRTGQVMVCENEGADWLPFRPFHTITSAAKDYTQDAARKKSVEVIWTND